MSASSADRLGQMVDYIYAHYENFKLLFKCGDSGKFEDFIHKNPPFAAVVIPNLFRDLLGLLG